MSSVLNYLPPFEGLLPKWLLFISVVSMANSIQAYASLTPTQRVYPGSAPPPSTSSHPPSSTASSKSASAPPPSSPVTPLSARTFGTWTAITSIIRLYAAYHIDNQPVYELALWTFGVAWAHFASEWFLFRTTRWGAGLAGPVVVSSVSAVWMWTSWDYYLKR